jgi:outer membrane protein assembly factor BamE
MQNIIKIIILGFFIIGSTSCLDSISENTKKIAEKVFPKGYKSNIQQGFEIDNSKIEQLKTGMSKTQVKKLIGSPDVVDPFHKNRWDYINYSRINDKQVNKSLTLIFDTNNTLREIKQ